MSNIFIIGMYISQNIKLLRESTGLSQQEFGYIFSLSRGQVRDYENNRSNPKRTILDKIGFLFSLRISTIEMDKMIQEDIKPPSNHLLEALEILETNRLLRENLELLSDQISMLEKSKIENTSLDENPKYKLEYKRVYDAYSQTLKESEVLRNRLQKRLQPFFLDSAILNDDETNEFINSLTFFDVINIINTQGVKDFSHSAKSSMIEDGSSNTQHHGTIISNSIHLKKQENQKIVSFTKPFKEYIQNGNFSLFENRIESEYGEFVENYLAERAVNKEPFDFFAYVLTLENNEQIFGFVKKINKEKWVIKEFKPDDHPLRFIDPKTVKELWILRKFFMLRDVEPQIFDIDKAVKTLNQTGNE